MTVDPVEHGAAAVDEVLGSTHRSSAGLSPSGFDHQNRCGPVR